MLLVATQRHILLQRDRGKHQRVHISVVIAAGLDAAPALRLHLSYPVGLGLFPFQKDQPKQCFQMPCFILNHAQDHPCPFSPLWTPMAAAMQLLQLINRACKHMCEGERQDRGPGAENMGTGAGGQPPGMLPGSHQHKKPQRWADAHEALAAWLCC